MGIKKQSHPIEETEIPNVGVIRKGKILEHPLFGIGEVLEIAKWESGDITVNVSFSDLGTKWLVPEYANFSEPKQPIEKTGLISRLFRGLNKKG